jgi:hypothetical protein
VALAHNELRRNPISGNSGDKVRFNSKKVGTLQISFSEKRLADQDEID